MEMTPQEMDAFREKNLRDASEHRRMIQNSLTPAQQRLRDYEDKMILRGETESNAYYEEWHQFKAMHR
jgi:hypothetical protein